MHRTTLAGIWSRFFPRSVRTRRFAIAALAACTIGAGPAAYAIDFDQGKVVNLGSLAVPILNNDGQLPGSVLFAAPGPTGNTVYFYDNTAIGLALRSYNNLDNSFTTISHVGANTEADFAAGDSRSSQTHYFSGGGITLPTNVSNYNNVVVNNLYDGVSAGFEITGRQLIGSYEVEASSTTAAIRLNFEDISEVVVNDETGDVELTLSSGRSIQLHAARVSVDGGELMYVPFSYDGDDAVLTLADFAEAEEGISITVKISFGPYYHDYYAVADENGESEELVVASTGFNTMMNGADDSDADMFITRLNAAGTDVISTTILAGEDEDIAYSVALTDAAAGPCGNRLYVAGSTRSGDFPASGERAGGTEAVVVRLNNTATAVEDGLLVSAGGRDVAHHVILCGCNVYVVGATDGGLAEVARNEMSFTTVLPSVSDAGNVQQYYLARADADLGSVENLAGFTGAAVALPLRGKCNGGGTVEIGVENGGVTTTECNSPANDISQMDNWFNSPCSGTPAVGWAEKPFWGWHALCWKQHKHSWANLNPGNCITPDVPFGVVYINDDQALDALEQTSCFGNEPHGTWHTNHYDDHAKTLTTNKKEAMAVELLLGAALYHKKFGSPVYANHIDHNLNTMAMLIHRVNMHITDNFSSPSTLQNVCNAFYANAKYGDDFDVACLNGLTGHLIFCSVGVVPWTMDAMSESIYPNNIMWDGKTLIENLSTAGIYVADPPEDEPHAPWFIQEIAHQLSHSVTAVTDVETTSYVDGEAGESTVTSRQIRMVAFPSFTGAVALPTEVEEQDKRLSISTPFGTLQSRPNPASGEISISYQVRDAAVVHLELYDALGQKLGLLDTGYRHPHQYTVSYDVSNLVAGTYYLRLSSNTGAVSIPLVILH